MTALALLSTLLVGAPPTPRVRLTYAPPDGVARCPSSPELRDNIASRLGYDPFVEPAEKIVTVEILRTAAELRAKLTLTDLGGAVQGVRELETDKDDCGELAQELGLAIGLAIDPLSLSRQPTKAAPKPAPPIPAPSTPLEWRLGLGPIGSIGVEPEPSVGLALQLELRWPGFSIAIEGRGSLPNGLNVAGGTATTSLLMGLVAPCFRLGAFGGCLLAAAGAADTAGSGAVQNQPVTTAYAAIGPRVFAELPLSRLFSFRAAADLLVPLLRTSIEVGSTTVWTSPLASGTLGLELMARFL